MKGGKRGQTKTPKYQGRVRRVLAANVRRLLDIHMPHSTNRPGDLARAAKISLSSAQRISSPTAEFGASVDPIEAVAKVFGLLPYQLLLEEPQVLLIAYKSAQERRRPSATHEKTALHR